MKQRAIMSACSLHALRHRRLRRHFPPKRTLNFTWLHGVIFQNVEFFIGTAVRTSNPAMLHVLSSKCSIFTACVYSVLVSLINTFLIQRPTTCVHSTDEIGWMTRTGKERGRIRITIAGMGSRLLVAMLLHSFLTFVCGQVVSVTNPPFCSGGKESSLSVGYEVFQEDIQCQSRPKNRPF
jgi:hypothetical protein